MMQIGNVETARLAKIIANIWKMKEISEIP